MTDIRDRLIIRSDLAELEKLFGFIDRFCAANGVANEVKYKLFLVAEELAVNSMSHGYGGATHSPVEIGLRRGERDVEVWVEDEAPAFDPFAQAPVPNTDTALAERRVGGLGIHLVRSLAEAVDYEHVNGRNVIRARLQAAAV